MSSERIALYRSFHEELDSIMRDKPEDWLLKIQSIRERIDAHLAAVELSPAQWLELVQRSARTQDYLNGD